MKDLIVALGLVLVIEGALWALAPRAALEMLKIAATAPEKNLRAGGAIAVAAGVLIVWLARG
jgi:uncharacterized protein YjeT (DUF2065 family)